MSAPVFSSLKPKEKRMRLNIGDIVVAPNRRSVDDLKVRDLADSIREVGLLNPITVTKQNRLIAGFHRLQACRLLGHREIECTLLSGDDLLLQLAEIDENLIRAELDPISVGELAIKRDDILESLGQRAAVGQGRPAKNGETVSPLKTTESIAKEIGVSGRTLQHNKQLARNLVAEAKDVVRTSEITKRDALKLARMPKERQTVIASRIKDGTAKSIKEAELVDARQKAKRQSKSSVQKSPPTVFLGDGIRWIDKQDYCDLLLTDPPYSTDVPDIGKFAQSWPGSPRHCERSR